MKGERRAYRYAVIASRGWLILSTVVVGSNYLLQKWLAPPAIVCSSLEEHDSRWHYAEHSLSQCARVEAFNASMQGQCSIGTDYNRTDAIHPWREWLTQKISRLPLGNADYCLIEKNMITQLILLKCRSFLKHLQRWGLSQSTPIFPSLPLSVAHTFCLREQRRRLNDGRDTLNTMSWHAATGSDLTPGSVNNNGTPLNQPYTDGRFQRGPLVVLVRDPIERFASGYVQACISKHTYPYIAVDWAGRCLGCTQGDVCCFVRRLAVAMQRPQVLDALSKITSNHIGEHLLPQTAYCGLSDPNTNAKLIPWSVRRTALVDTLVQHGIQREYLDRGWGKMGKQSFLASHTMHATGALQKQVLALIRRSPQLQDTLRYIYRDDYEFIARHNLTGLL